VLPMHPLAGTAVLTLAFAVQCAVQRWVLHMPSAHMATYLLQYGSEAEQHSIASFCRVQ